MKSLTLSPILSDTKLILKAYKRPLLLISVLMGMLIFVMNVFLATAQYGTSFNLQMKDKLGIYVYLKENVTPENQPDIALKSALEAQGLRVEYTSKQDALKFVEKRIPDLVATFKKYHLDNPLPTTLYVKYSNQEEFQRMKKVLSHYKEMILNGNELSDTTIKTQEKRILNIINLSTFLQSFAYFVVGTMILTIIAFAIFFLKSTFSHFYADIQAKKLLGATARQIIQPFLNAILLALGLAFLFAAILLVGTLIPFSHYLTLLFNFDLVMYLKGSIKSLLITGGAEIGGVLLLLMSISYRYVWNLHRKLR